MAKYELEDDEKTLMEEVFNLAQKFVDLQIDDATAEELQEVLNTSALLFGILQQEVIVEEDPNTGNLTITVKEVEAEDKHSWTPTVINNPNKPEGPSGSA